MRGDVVDKFMVTHSLLSAWSHALKDNPHAKKDVAPMIGFMKTLRREPSVATEAMQSGIKFEMLVTDIMCGNGDKKNKWYEAARDVARIIEGGQLQVVAKKEAMIDDVPVLLYGRIDALKAGVIYDIKYTEKYESGKYLHSTQHPMYFELIPEALEFTYLVSDGSNVFPETYRRDETMGIHGTIEVFFAWLEIQELSGVYRQYWKAL